MGVQGLELHINYQGVKPDGSPIRIGMTGVYEGKIFTLKGHLQYIFDTGLENQWYALFDDGTEGWLCETFFQYTMCLELDYHGPKTTTMLDYIVVANEKYYLTAIRKYMYVRWQGYLPFNPALESAFTVYEMQHESSPTFVSVTMYGNNKTLLYLAHSVQLSDLSLSPSPWSAQA
jgi:hypothetical protein